MKQEIKNFDRIELFEHFNSSSNPFSFITTKIEVTKLYNFCQKNRSHYATIGYYVVSAMNEIDAFKYRYENGKFYKYDKLNATFTQKFKNNNIGFFTCEMTNNYDEFIKEYKSTEQKFLQNSKSYRGNTQGEVLLSCEPWFNFSSAVVPYDKNICVPKVIWDRFNKEGDKCYLNFMIMSHHGFVDGYHIGKYINKLQELLNNIEY